MTSFPCRWGRESTSAVRRSRVCWWSTKAGQQKSPRRANVLMPTAPGRGRRTSTASAAADKTSQPRTPDIVVSQLWGWVNQSMTKDTWPAGSPTLSMTRCGPDSVSPGGAALTARWARRGRASLRSGSRPAADAPTCRCTTWTKRRGTAQSRARITQPCRTAMTLFTASATSASSANPHFKET